MVCRIDFEAVKFTGVVQSMNDCVDDLGLKTGPTERRVGEGERWRKGFTLGSSPNRRMECNDELGHRSVDYHLTELS